MTIDGVDLRRFPSGSGAQIQYTLAYEEREAARFAGIPWQEYQALHRAERAHIVAHHRTHNQIQGEMDRRRQKAERRAARRK